MSRNVLLISTEELKARTSLSVNVDDKLLFAEVKKAQDMYIEPALGSALFDRIQTGFVDNDLTADEQNLRSRYIIDALLMFTMARLPVGTSMQISNIGAFQRTAENTQSLSMEDMLALEQRNMNDAEWYLQRLINYLVANRDTFPLYAYDEDNDLNPKKTAFEIPIYLGDYDDDNTCSDYD